jgi:hypothetical protein
MTKRSIPVAFVPLILAALLCAAEAAAPTPTPPPPLPPAPPPPPPSFEAICVTPQTACPLDEIGYIPPGTTCHCGRYNGTVTMK